MLRRALFYTPAVREEFILRNASAWPATFDHKHNGCFNNVFSRSSTEDIPRGAVIPRGFKTRASHLGKPFTNCNSTSTGKVNAPRITLMPDGTPILPIPMLSREEEIRLRAFADGFSEGKSKSQSSWGVVSLLRDFLVLGVFTAAALYFLNGTRFSTVVMGTKNEVRSTEIDVKFDDVIGVETAKQELQEIVEFLKNPEKFSHLGGRLPKGVLLMGPPGTGKTLLARAVAGEAGVPFFHAAGPEFDEMLIGQGARRMRDLFQAAKAKAPCVIFIDEIDSVGSARSSSVLHPHANQTINQLLTEMDGFRQNEGVIVLGATNRRDDLDPALLRPGRFDIEVQVPKPDFNGRKSLLEYYTSKVKIDKNVDVEYLARGTTGFTGADIENMVNQAALRAAIVGEDSVTQSYLEYARDKVLMGPETKNRIPDHQDNLITAYHEAGHALVAYHSEGNMSLHKVTILARGSALGHTSFIPIKDDCHCTKSEILAKIDSALGGKAAEELVFGPENVTTGATADLKYATDLATHMVKSWGMSDKVGDRYFKTQTDALARANDISNEMSELIDEEVKRFLKEAKERALRILTTRRAQLNLLAEALMKYETLDSKDVRELLETGSLKR